MNKVLFIVEGPKDEVHFISRLFETCFRTSKFKTYSYCASLHSLAKELTSNYPNFEDDEVDIRLVLKSIAPATKNTDVLDLSFTDIFLIFDMEPHQDFPRFDIIDRMIKYFDDSTNHGKLFINYPMMQSIKHFSVLPDPSFQNRIITIKDAHHYKQIVGNMSSFSDLTKYDYVTFYSLCQHHLAKANYILNKRFLTPSLSEYFSLDYSRLFQLELINKDDNGYIDVLNTSIFILSDFAPKKFFSFLEHHKSELFLA